jgi:hypothetical protein
METVGSAWTRFMEGLAEEEAAFLAALPALGGGVAGADEEDVILLATLDRAPLPRADYRVRIRSGPDDRDTEVMTFPGLADEANPQRVHFAVPRSLLRGRTFQYQFGQALGDEAWPYFEEWQTASIPR